MSVVYANKGGSGLSNLFKMALSTFGGPVGQAASAIWSAAQGDIPGAISGGMSAAGINPLQKLFWSKNFAGQVPKSPYDLYGWSPDLDTTYRGVR